RQRRIHNPRARCVFAAGQLLDRADEVIAVAWFVRDQLEQDESKLAASKHAAAVAAAALRFITEVKMERTPPALPPGPAPHGVQAFREVELETAAWAAPVMSMSHKTSFDASK